LTLGALLRSDTRVLDALGGDLGACELPARETVFLDTETTGLSGGAGCLVFLVGLGWYEGDTFVVEQHTLLSPGDEPSFLEGIAKRLAAFRAVATFFGKAFDRPRLEDRFAYHGMRTRLPADPHVDLHGLGRRIWAGRFGDCRLQTFEREVLGFERTDDLPGALCPEAFRCFLDGDPFLLEGVLEHNLNDILSLAVLAEAVCREARRPTTQRGRLAVARGRAHSGDHLGAIRLLEAACAAARDHGAADATAAIALGDLLKRCGRLDDAVAHWKAMAAAEEAGAYPHVELAKHFEHRAGAPTEALAWARRAEAICPPGERAEITHRIARLERRSAGEPTRPE
jgi:hypothetical protein